MAETPNLTALLASSRDLSRLWRDLELIELRANLAGEATRPTAAGAEELNQLAKSAGIEIAVINDFLASLGTGGQASGKLEQFGPAFEARRGEISTELASFPAGTEKTRHWLDALVAEGRPEDTDLEAYTYLREEVGPTQVEEVAVESRSEWRDAIERRAAAVSEYPNMFWTSLDNQDLNDGLARYGFYTAFALGEFQAVTDDVRAFIGHTLLEGARMLEPFGGELWPNPETRSVAETIFLAARPPRLASELAPVISLALTGLGRFQNDDGSWSGPSRPERGGTRTVPPDTVATAAAAIAIQKLSGSEDLRGRAGRAVDWLIQVQQPEGNWSLHGSEPSDLEWPILQRALRSRRSPAPGEPTSLASLTVASSGCLGASPRAAIGKRRRYPIHSSP